MDLRDSIITLVTERPITASLLKELNSSEDNSIGFLPTHTWFSSSFQRPHQLARAMAELGCKVVYWEPWQTPANIVREEKRKRRFLGIQQIEPNLFLLRCPEKLLFKLYNSLALDALIMVWPLQIKNISLGSPSMLIYEILDDPSLYPDKDGTWQTAHENSIRSADIVTTTADDLYKQVCQFREDTILLPNGVRLEDWQKETVVEIPVDMKDIREAPVVVGYFGVIAEWMDWSIWQHAAKMHPDWEFVIIGQTYWRYQIPYEMRQISNLHFLGPKPYQSLPAYIYYFDVVTIPFILNEISHACSPVKLFEYMAAMKPVVATPMREILKYKSVFIGDTPQEFVTQLEFALTKRNNESYLFGLDQTARANTWNARAIQLIDAIRLKKNAQNGIPRRKSITDFDFV
jgi:glycosyltransferase involved in cell wall biosynthesis